MHSVLLLFRSRTFYLAENPAEWAFVVDMESFFSFAIETKKHPTRFAMPPVSSAGMTLRTDGHFYSPCHRIGGAHICEQVDVLLGGEAVNLHQELPAQSPSVAQAGSTTVRRFKSSSAVPSPPSVLVQDERLSIYQCCYVLEFASETLCVFGMNRNQHLRLQSRSQFLQVLQWRMPARMRVDEVDCWVAAASGDSVTAEVVGVGSVEIAEPLRVDDIDGGCGVLEFINETKAGHLAEVEKRFGSCV